MGLFKKKRRMIDVRELQKGGRLHIPKANTPQVESNQEGFVDFSSKNTNTQEDKAQHTNGGFFGFMDTTSQPQNTTEKTLSPNTTPSEDLRKLQAQLTSLDNTIYKLEQRIELLEKKNGIETNSNSANTFGGMW